MLTADKGIEYVQDLQTLAIAVLIDMAKGNRVKDLTIAIPEVLAALQTLAPRTLQKVGGYRSP